MGKITDALRKATEERLLHMERIAKIKEADQIVIRKMGDSKIDPRIITYFDSKSHISEQYKILRTNLFSVNKGKTPPRVIAVTSSIHSEGKTITSLNLAISLARAVNKPKILLVDADMRRGRLAKYLGVQHDVGLSEYLSEKTGIADLFFNIDIENLTFVASGMPPAHPAELLGSERMRGLLQELKSKFDYIIIDTPPIIAVTDPGIIGAECDGVLLVIQAGRTQRGIVRSAMEHLHQAQAKILGHVLTNIEYHLPEYIYRYL
ncbi:MAG TPA: CpsD/CapB family tyrosine-protein kinase [Candidatus Omnitrophota bacterium]|nr:CpsD/CapB family tyrosine-protein kinase [Candidatus Omnitrophota bacterium]HPD85172.1 CpsD/CapB family tyrosine-protein kinase [Candidatus Omnitrophota bacterium]HRZ04327.1 CpsD/CapB family tyrosine-protein kinase [Candidatus Omnitrophota bacterium]